jgi:hypothetical protein
MDVVRHICIVSGDVGRGGAALTLESGEDFMGAPPLDEDVREQPLLLDFVEQLAPFHSLPDPEAFSDEIFIALLSKHRTSTVHDLDSISLGQQTPKSR